ncbi:MAG TPA: hypothetical protein VFZ66_28985 [Herpetosiphonaceae bacterium]
MEYNLFHIGLILEIGIIVLAMVLFRFARVLGGLLDLIHRPPLEVWLKLSGWIMIIGFAVLHYIAVAFLYPNVANPRMLQLLWIARSISFFSLLVAAVLAFVPSFLYYRWTNQ